MQTVNILKPQAASHISDGLSTSAHSQQEKPQTHTEPCLKLPTNPLNELAEMHKKAIATWVGVAIELGVEKEQAMGWLTEAWEVANG
jgi:hypothetical protein